ncbi:MAG: methyltransferase domain-containing protein [Pseudomonadota bacterium]
MTVVTEQPSGFLMDRIYRHQRFIYDLTRKYYLLGRDKVVDDLKPDVGDAILEIGCGTGRNLIKAAQRYPEARCYGVDISKEMLTTAEASIKRKRLQERISVFRGDATNFDGATLVGQPSFERIFISYSLSMIPSWRATMERAMRSLAPGGRLVIIDFGGLGGWPSWFRRSLLKWLSMFHVTPRVELPEEAAILAGNQGYQVTSTGLYRGYAHYITIERPKSTGS